MVPVRHQQRAALFPYTTLFRSDPPEHASTLGPMPGGEGDGGQAYLPPACHRTMTLPDPSTSADAPGGTAMVDAVSSIKAGPKIGRAHVELQSQSNLVCRLLLEK